jgi:putative lipoprotein
MRNKMKKMLMGLALIVATLSVSSCATRESAVNDLEKFSYELRDNSQYYTAKKWRKAVNKFGRIRREIARHDYTVAERQRIGRLEGDCARYMVRGAKDGVVNSVFGLGSEIQGILDALGIKRNE